MHTVRSRVSLKKWSYSCFLFECTSKLFAMKFQILDNLVGTAGRSKTYQIQKTLFHNSSTFKKKIHVKGDLTDEYFVDRKLVYQWNRSKELRDLKYPQK